MLIVLNAELLHFTSITINLPTVLESIGHTDRVVSGVKDLCYICAYSEDPGKPAST